MLTKISKINIKNSFINCKRICDYMKVRVNDELVDVNNDDYLSEGMEGTCYKVGKQVIKILHKYPKKIYLNEEDINRLKNISVRVLEHPIDSAIDNDGRYLGPVSNYIRGSGYYDFSNLDSEQFIENVDFMIRDGKTYAENMYLIADLQYDDTIFDKDGNWHLIDSGSYSYMPNMRVSQLERLNLEEIDNYLLEEVIDNLLIKKGISKKRREIIKKQILKDSEMYESVSLYLKEEMKKHSSVSEFVREIKK